MPAIIPIRAFTDNYISILREPTDPFRRVGEPAVLASAEVRAGRNPAGAMEALAALRAQKNEL